MMKKKRVYQPEDFSKDLKFQKEFILLQDQINDFTDKLKNLKTLMKKMESSYVSDLNKVHKMKKLSNSAKKKDSGFVSKRSIPKELSTFIGEKENTQMTLPEYTKKFCSELKKRNLIYEKDKRVYRVDKILKKIFGFTDEVNNSTSSKDKEGFNFSTLQKNLNKAFEKYSKKKEEIAIAY